jgi:hypothetical protein
MHKHARTSNIWTVCRKHTINKYTLRHCFVEPAPKWTHCFVEPAPKWTNFVNHNLAEIQTPVQLLESSEVKWSEGKFWKAEWSESGEPKSSAANSAQRGYSCNFAPIEILDLEQVCWHRPCKHFGRKKPL